MTLKKLTTLAGLVAGATLSAHATSLNLITDADGYINDAYFTRTLAQSTGTGVINPFVRLQDNGVADGYNADARPVMPDVNNSGQFTRDLKLSSVPILSINNISYYEFLLDINQTAANPFLSLDKIEIYTRSSPLGTANTLAALTGPGSTPRYSLGAGNEILLDYNLNNGSGSGDMLAYIPTSLFGPETDYLYFYSQFGGKGTIGTGQDRISYEENDGFEEWAVKERSTPTTVPDGGATVALLGVGLVGLGMMRRKLS